VSGERHGDAELAERLAGLPGPRHRPAAAAVVTAEETRSASLGAGLGADFEIGSIAKGITGLLYAEALARGEAGPGTPLGDLLPLADVPVGKVTLGSLSTHRSGLPSLPAAAQPFRRTVALWRRGANPYGEDLEQLLEQARSARLGRPRARYSPATPDELRAGAVTGSGRHGGFREAWTGEAIAPAGGIRASITDMARLTRALLDGSAPGVAALDPVAPFSMGMRIGAAWITMRAKGRIVTWHNGGTGGFRSWLGLDREAGTGAVMLSATAASVDRHGFALLGWKPAVEG
jgi:CubicO group peptidase (beta-lactamase class C family)